MQKLIKNPFGISRVDTPFQEHIDIKDIYSTQYETIKSILNDIKGDVNRQSRGVCIVGDAGSGKTHLIMRLAKDRLAFNRILFIRQPNNSKYVLFHIYNRILESFTQRVPNSDFTQLEYLLAKSFSKIIIKIFTSKDKLSKKDSEILEKLTNNPLDLYDILGRDGTANKRKNWKYLEKKMISWWSENYGFGGYSIYILKALIKFCTYSDEGKKLLVRKYLSGAEVSKDELNSTGLESLHDLDKEEFSLEAISTFGKLSTVDEPLIIVFDQLEALKHNEELLINFGEALKEIFTHTPNALVLTNIFADRLHFFSTVFEDAIMDRLANFKIYLNSIDSKLLKTILQTRADLIELDIDEYFTIEELQSILSQKSIRKALNLASELYRCRENKIEMSYSKENHLEDEIYRLKREIKIIKSRLNLNVKSPNFATENQKILDYINLQIEFFKAEYYSDSFISDIDDVGKLDFIAKSFSDIKTYNISKLEFSKKLPENVLIEGEFKKVCICFLNLDSNSFTMRLKNLIELIELNSDTEFKIFRDERSRAINSKEGKRLIHSLVNYRNSKFLSMDILNRVIFEVIYKVLSDILNRDFEADFLDTLEVIEFKFNNYWLVEVIK